MAKRTPNFQELNEIFIMPKEINEIIHGYMSNPFIIVLNVGLNATTRTPKIAIPSITANGGFCIDWGDNVCEYFSVKAKNAKQTKQNITHTYTHCNTYAVHVYGDIIEISFRKFVELIEISQWGDLRLHSGRGCFNGCNNLTITAHDLPNLKNAKDLSYMFACCRSLNSDLSKWDVSNVVSMSSMFAQCFAFNADISKWNVSKVTNMTRMFNLCKSFNVDLSKWNVSKVTNMSYMFGGCYSFNSDLSKWDVRNVIRMCSMFLGCNAFNCNLSKWQFNNNSDKIYMFGDCKAFNTISSKWNNQ